MTDHHVPSSVLVSIDGLPLLHVQMDVVPWLFKVPASAFSEHRLRMILATAIRDYLAECPGVRSATLLENVRVDFLNSPSRNLTRDAAEAFDKSKH